MVGKSQEAQCPEQRAQKNISDRCTDRTRDLRRAEEFNESCEETCRHCGHGFKKDIKDKLNKSLKNRAEDRRQQFEYKVARILMLPSSGLPALISRDAQRWRVFLQKSPGGPKKANQATLKLSPYFLALTIPLWIIGLVAITATGLSVRALRSRAFGGDVAELTADAAARFKRPA